MAARCLIQHNRHFLRENKKQSRLFTDNLPVSQAWRKMKTGVWSKSSKVATLLTTLSVYNLEILHVPGVKQKYGDYNSRNPLSCDFPKCQICRYAFRHVELDVPNMFITNVSSTMPKLPSKVKSELEVKHVTADQIERGEIKIPFTEKSAWLKVQKSDKLHRELVRLIKNGQIPEKKKTGNYNTLLNVCIICTGRVY